MKKPLLLLLTGILVICLAMVAGCGNKENKEAANSDPTGQTEQQQPKDSAGTDQGQQTPAQTTSEPALQPTAAVDNQNKDAKAADQAGNKTPAATASNPATTSKQPATAKPQTESKPAPKPAETPRIDKYFFSMPSRFLPDTAKDVACVYQFNITDGQKGKYIVTIKDGKCTVVKGTAPKPDITINTGEQLWLDIATDKTNGTTAYLTRKFTAEGDTDYLSNMKKYFNKFEG